MEEVCKQLAVALNKNNMAFYYAETKDDAVGIVKSLLKKGEIIGMGGSRTIEECGVLALVKNGDYNFLDRCNCTDDMAKQHLCHRMLTADTFLTSTNAITLDGVLYNVDGNSNRVSNIAYGAKQVIVVAGKNKIVSDLSQAILRVKTIAAPKNAQRMHTNTPCEFSGKCISLNNPNSTLEEGCDSEKRICCNYLISATQRYKDRIKVILVNEELGF